MVTFKDGGHETFTYASKGASGGPNPDEETMAFKNSLSGCSYKHPKNAIIHHKRE